MNWAAVTCYVTAICLAAAGVTAFVWAPVLAAAVGCVLVQEAFLSGPGTPRPNPVPPQGDIPVQSDTVVSDLDAAN